MNKTKEQNIVLSAKLGLLALGTFAITLAIIILFAINLKWQTTNNNDISGWCSLIVGSAIGIYITFAILIYSNTSQKKTDELIEKISMQQDEISKLITKVNEIESIKRKSEFQHYKERLTFETEIFLHRIDFVRTTIEQPNNLMLNLSHAKTNLASLRNINSIFTVPSEIRSEFDHILSDYESILESIEHNCTRLFDISKLISGCTQDVKKFFTKDFFHEENTEQIDKNLNKIDSVIIRICSS